MLTTEVMTLSLESIDKYRDWLFDLGRSSQTVKAYASDLTTLLRETKSKEIPSTEFERTALRWLRETRGVVAAKTTTRRLTSLKSFAKWAKWGEVFKDYTAPHTPPGQPHPIPEGMDGVRRMIAQARQPHHAALVALCGMGGLRMHEALAIRASNFTPQTMMLRVLGKYGKYRDVPVSDEMWSHIASCMVESFTNNDQPLVMLHERVARKVVTRLAEKAKLQRHVKSHDLRATFATELYNKTLDINLVRKILGHSSVETTQIYTGVTQQSMRDAVAKI